MTNESENTPHFHALIPFGIFIGIYLGTGFYLEFSGVKMGFYKLPGPVAAMVGVAAAFMLFKGSLEQKFNDFLSGCGDKNIMTMCVIYLLAGAFAVVSKAMGGVDATVNLGITYIPPQYLAAGIFAMASFISLAIGTSVGAIVALGPIAVGLAEEGHLSLALVLAALMGGAMFGDNLSIISDTTIASTRTQDVGMQDKFKINLYIALPASVLTLILLLIWGQPPHATPVHAHSYELIKTLPYVFVLVLALLGVNVFLVLFSGIALSGGIGLYGGHFTWLSLGQEVYKGFSSMQEIFLLSLLTGGLAYMVDKEGGVAWIISKIEGCIKGAKSAKVGIAALVSLVDLAVANNTVAIVIVGAISKKISLKFGVDRRESAVILDVFSCVFQGIIPYGAQMLILLSFAKEHVGFLEVAGFLWYQGLLGLFTFLYIFWGAYSQVVLKRLPPK
ncbi:sodium:proton antiporter [Helicobacter sp. NHP19-012]|uniref:Sodium:proton antiporter n=1 Tax=Helicobacter gastrofelis TaxID=2849642 RepID=A0ABM7SF19_9HELI|nr:MULTISPECIES: Na+/H+ antiporter NhaC family protein [unclassified Helicobacter]BCZ18428.1 sodium:proton antiporter [Helicobacter sp. NHP19-012]GMB95709.1 Na+/H+ antiporter NhaC family protein [Helicobacter sp. NHP22-001]